MELKRIGFRNNLLASAWFVLAVHFAGGDALSQQVKGARFCKDHHRMRPHLEYSAVPGEKLSPQRNSYHCKLLFRVTRAGAWVKHDIVFIPEDPALKSNADSFRREKSEKQGKLPDDAGYPEDKSEDRDPELEKRYGGIHIYRRYETLGQNKSPGYRTGVGFKNRGRGEYILLIRDAKGEELGEYRFTIRKNEAVDSSVPKTDTDTVVEESEEVHSP